MRSRRYLPSISLLSAFEAVLKTGSTAAAARELNLTQSTVSRLIQNLEKQLGRPLFRRYRQKLIPTDVALAYVRDISRALDLIERSSIELSANPGGNTLSLSVLPAFGSDWLVPRLSDFKTRCPDISLNLATRMKRFNFAAESFDAAIHFGKPDWRDAGHMKIFDEQLTACISPTLAKTHPVCTIKDMYGLPLLQLETRPEAWNIWFKAQGSAPPPTITGMLFDQFAPMTQAAISSLGVALLPQYLARSEIAENHLAPVLKPSIIGSGSYWLVWPEARANYPPLEAFRHWLTRLIAEQAL